MNEKNLQPFKAGHDNRRNVSGRPRRIPELEELLGEVLAEPTPEGVSAARQILEALLAKAKKGDTRAAEILLDRAYGKPKQMIEAAIEKKETEPAMIDIDTDRLTLEEMRQLMYLIEKARGNDKYVRDEETAAAFYKTFKH